MKKNPQRRSFEEWELETTRIIVRKARRNWKPYFDRLGEDDLIQDCLLSWLKVRDKYTADLNASKKTYLSTVVSNRLKNILKKINSSHEKINQIAVSLNKYGYRQIEERIRNDKSYLFTGLHEDLSKALSTLTPSQRKLCSLLSQPGMNKKKAAEKLGIHRSLAYRELNRIKDIFEKEGFREYLRNFLAQ